MKILASLGFVLAFGSAALAADAPTAQQRYDALVAQVKGGDTDVDYTELRNTYSQTDAYDPYGVSDSMAAMVKAFNGNDCPAAVAAANTVLETNFSDLRSHAVIAQCSERAGDTAASGTQRSIVRGLLNSIARSGDGQSADTAFVVIAVREEYDFLGLQGFQVKGQSLVDAKGHEVDALQVVDEDGKPATYFFNVDKPFAWMAKSLTPKDGKTQ